MTTKQITLLTGNDSKIAAELIKGFRATQKAGRVIMAFGLFAWEVQLVMLKHGQWGKWLLEHAPELCKRDNKGELLPEPCSALDTYKNLAKDVLEDMGFTVKKYLEHISNPHGMGICHYGKFLLMPPKKITGEAADLRKQICDRVDNKTLKQMRLQFSQVEEDANGELRVKRGRLKGSSGLTKEQREAAKLRAEQERIEDLELAAVETAEWLEENCDAKNVGLISESKARRLAESVQYAHDYLTNLEKSRKGQ